MDPLKHVVAMGPSRHALRGFSATLAATTLLTTILRNRRELLSFKASQLLALRVAKPTRNALAIAVFIGVFRFVERWERSRKSRHPPPQHHEEQQQPKTEKHHHSVQRALIAASMSSILCVEPGSRTPLVALLSTNAISVWFNDFIAKNPQFAAYKPLDLIVFLVSGGWLLLAALMYPESYEKAHIKLLMKYSITSQQAATYLQSRYKQGINPNTCDARHPGKNCGEFFMDPFAGQVIAMGLRVYFPVHFTTWLFALRHRKVRQKPLTTHIQQLATRVSRSSLYFIVYILLGWTIPCYTNQIGSRSIAWRKFQLFVCGSLPALAILFESPSRRRPVAVILSTYSFVSLGAVIAQQKHFQWLQQGSGPVRTAIDMAALAASVAYTMESLTQGNALFQRMLFGGGASGGATPRSSERVAPVVVAHELKDEIDVAKGG